MADKRRDIQEIIDDLMTLTSIGGYMHVISEIASRDLFLDLRDATTIDWRSKLSYQELTFLLGLTIKSSPLSYNELKPEVVEEAIKHTRALLDELHWYYNGKFIDKMAEVANKDGGPKNISKLTEEQKDKHFREVFGSKESMIEATFYGDSGSYDFQYLDMAPRLYRKDKSWVDKTGLDFAKAKLIYQAIKFISEKMHHAYTHPEIAQKRGWEPVRAIDQFAFSKESLTAALEQIDVKSTVSQDDVDKFLDLFTINPEEQYPDFQKPGDLNIVNIKPIIKIAENSYFVAVNFNLAEAIYQSPAYWMRQDQQYLDTAAKNRGAASEQIAYELLKPVFGKYTYKSLKVIKGKDTLTDIDVMGVIGNTAIVIQNKGKGMTKDALKGNEEILKKDFKLAIQSAYDQGIESRDILLGTNDYKFVDENDQDIKLPQGIEEVYVLCVTTNVYPAVIHQVNVYLNKAKDKPWPMAINLFDLEILVEYLSDPYDLTYYIKQRIDLTESVKASGEMALLGYHLKYGLFRPQSADLFTIDQDFAQFIDADYMYRKLKLQKPPAKYDLKTFWRNEKFENLLLELRENIKDPKLTNVIFYLKTLPHEVVDDFMKLLSETRKTSLKDKEVHDFSMPLKDGEAPWGGLTYVTGRTMDEVRQKLEYLVGINKYRSGTDTWLGLGSLIGQKSLVNAVLYANDPWKKDEAMEEAVETHEQHSKGRLVGVKQLRRVLKTEKKESNKKVAASLKKKRRNAVKKSKRINRKKKK